MSLSRVVFASAQLNMLTPLLPRAKSQALCQLAHSTLRQELRLTKGDFQRCVETLAETLQAARGAPRALRASKLLTGNLLIHEPGKEPRQALIFT